MMRARSTFVLALALAACTPGGAAMTGGGGGAGGNVTTIDVNLTLSQPVQTPYGLSGAMTPPVTTVPVGAVIQFTNTDGFAHTASLIPGIDVSKRLAADVGCDDAARQHHLDCKLDERRDAGRNEFAADYRRQSRHVLIRLLLPFRSADERSDRCSVGSSRPIAAMLVLFALGTQRASAIPIFAQRYHFNCTQCHSVLAGTQRVRQLLPFARVPAAAAAPRHDDLCDPLSVGVWRRSAGGNAPLVAGRHRFGRCRFGPDGRVHSLQPRRGRRTGRSVSGLSRALRRAHEDALSLRALRTAADSVAGTAARRSAGVRLLSNARRFEQLAAGLAALGRAGRKDRRQPAHRWNGRRRGVSRRAVRRQTRRHGRVHVVLRSRTGRSGSIKRSTKKAT